jgi:hypothetical protein
MNPDLIAPIDPGDLRDQELQLKLERFRYDAIHKVPSYDFRMMHAATAEDMGTIRLRVGSTKHVEMYAGHIGYDVYEAHRGHRYASRSVRLLMPASRAALLVDHLRPGECSFTALPGDCGSRVCGDCECPADCVIHKAGHPRKCRYRLDLSLTSKFAGDRAGYAWTQWTASRAPQSASSAWCVVARISSSSP